MPVSHVPQDRQGLLAGNLGRKDICPANGDAPRAAVHLPFGKEHLGLRADAQPKAGEHRVSVEYLPLLGKGDFINRAAGKT